MEFGSAVRTVFRDKAFTKQGRATRSEYWWASLAYYLTLIAASFVISSIGGAAMMAGLLTESESALAGAGVGMILMLLVFVVVMFYMGMAMLFANVRRFHDRGLSGWWVVGILISSLIPFLNFIAFIANIVICCLESAPDNKWGPNPVNYSGLPSF